MTMKTIYMTIEVPFTLLLSIVMIMPMERIWWKCIWKFTNYYLWKL